MSQKAAEAIDETTTSTMKMTVTTNASEQSGPSSTPTIEKNNRIRSETYDTTNLSDDVIVDEGDNVVVVSGSPSTRRLFDESSPSQSVTFSCSFDGDNDDDDDEKQHTLSSPPSSPTNMTPLLPPPQTPPTATSFSPTTSPLNRPRLSSQISSFSSSPIPLLGSNMMYEHQNRDPNLYYKTLEVIGVGSMGSVSRVKKRLSAVGGSARLENSLRGKQIRKNERRMKKRNLFSNCCLGGENNHDDGKSCFGGKWMQLFNRSTDKGNILSIPSATTTTAAAAQYNNPLTLPTLDDNHDDDDYHIPQLAASHHSTTTTPLSYSHHSHSSSPPKEYALKSIHLQRLTKKTALSELQNEIEILKTLDHAHIVKPIETFKFQQQIYLVMEMCHGGDLYSRDPYGEEEAARIVGSVLSAIKYMHKRGVVHRDLKFENIMFVNDHPQSEVKVIDFGLSAKYGPEDPVMSDGVGTIYTMAPEVLKGKYTSQADLWSIGVLAYMLLSSRVPFYGTTRREIAKKIKKCQYDFKGKRWNKISPQAKNFVSELLLIDPKERPTAEEASQSVWLNRRFECTQRSPDDAELGNIQASLQNFAHYGKLKKLALMVVAHKSTSEEIGFLRKAFETYDDNHDGFIDFDDFQDALQRYGYEEEEIVDMFLGADIDSTGSIKYTEFLAATIEAHGAINEERLAEAFDRLDTDDSGYITAENLQELLGDDLPLSEIKSIISECGLTNDHQISYEEFLSLWDQYQEDQREAAFQQIRRNRSSMEL